MQATMGEAKREAATWPTPCEKHRKWFPPHLTPHKTIGEALRGALISSPIPTRRGHHLAAASATHPVEL